MGLRKYIILLLMGIQSMTCVFSQEQSTHVQQVNGKAYYIHPVKKSESLYGISKLYGTDVESILNANPEVKEKGLKAGQKIFIPVKTESNSQVIVNKDTLHFKYHKVLKGRTIYSLCKEYKLSQEQFYELNPDKKSGIKENDWVIVGKRELVKLNNETVFSKQIKKDGVEKFNASIPEMKKKNEYHLCLMLPFGTTDNENIVVEDIIKNNQNFPLMSSMMIDFYIGLKYAADSLQSDSFKLKILPLDITEHDSLKLINVLSLKEYQNADLVIGPLYSSLIKLEQNTEIQQKPHIIPFLSQNKFLFNHIEYSKTTPSIYTDIKKLAAYVFDSLRKNSTVVILNTGINAEKEYVKEFKRYYNELIYQHHLKDTIITFRNVSDFKKYAKEKQNYTLVLLSHNQVIATDYITQLNIIHKTSPITLCGFYKTITFDNIDLEYLNQMKFTFVNYQNTESSKKFLTTYEKKYKEEFLTEPSSFFYEGLYIGLYYFQLIKNYGLSALYNLSQYNEAGENGFMRFEFYHPDDNSGFQNNGVYVYQMMDRKLIIKR